MSLVRSLFALLVVGSLGCAVEHAPADDAEPNASNDEAVSTKLPPPSLAQRLYFPNTTNPLPYGGGGVVWPYPAAGQNSVTSYWTFDAKGGTDFTVSVSAYDDGEGIQTAPLSLTVYYLYRGKWRRADSSKGKGTTSISFSPTYDHQWLIAATGDVGSPDNNLEISLGCDSGVDEVGHSLCARAQEPGDACGGLAAAKFKCETGLYCDFGATCGAGDQQGHCAIAPTSCPATKGGTAPVCGCDGATYTSECAARQAGVSVAHAAACTE